MGWGILQSAFSYLRQCSVYELRPKEEEHVEVLGLPPESVPLASVNYMVLEESPLSILNADDW